MGQAQRDELVAILNRLESGLDYFGNPRLDAHALL